MSVFKLPVWVVKSIDRIRRKFLWHGVNSGNKKLAWVNWKSVTKPKKVGGLGILDLNALNSALLSKWLWKWNQSDHSLWKSLASALQNRSLSLLPANSKLTASITSFACFLDVGLAMSISDGKKTLFWHHNWSSQILKFAFPDLFSFALDTNISVRLFFTNRHNPSSLFSPLLSTSHLAISQLQSLLSLISNWQLTTSGTDVAVWKLTGGSSSFTTKSLYNLIKLHPSLCSTLWPIWKLTIPPRFKVFLWQLFQNKIATLDNLQKRGWILPNRCCLCSRDSESVIHLFNHCDFYQHLRALLLVKNCVLDAASGSEFPLLHSDILEVVAIKEQIRDLFAIFYFVIWRERCNRIFKELSKSNDELLTEVLLEWKFLRR